jgi:ubiquitin carboxyl-terminal hydrolase 34
MEFKSETERDQLLSHVIQKPTLEKSQLNYEIPYDSFKRFVPSQLYKEVWLDNHQFMLEKHIYSDDFFAFFKEILTSIPLPKDYVRYTNQPYYGIYA